MTWAIITGATAGIGEAFCHELSQRAINKRGQQLRLLIISRSESKLQSLRQELLKNFNNNNNNNNNNTTSIPVQSHIQVDYLVRDFADTSATQSFNTQLHSKLETILSTAATNKHPTHLMLFNCVGIVNQIPANLHQTPTQELQQMLSINIEGTFHMTNIVLSYMRKLQQISPLNKCSILTVSSGGCNHPTPMLATYTATKAFGSALSDALAQKTYSPDMTCIRPYYYETTHVHRNSSAFFVPKALTVARLALNAMNCQRINVSPYWAHTAAELLTKHTPIDPAPRIMRNLQQTRERHLAKQMQGQQTAND